MAKMFWEKDANPRALEGKRIAVIGYGSQGRAHALNLRDSKLDVVVGLRRAALHGRRPRRMAGSSRLRSKPRKARTWCDACTRYGAAADLREGNRAESEGRSDALFSHGFNIHYGQITPPKDVDVTMVAPKGPGNLVRRQYEAGRGVPCLSLCIRTLRAMHSTARLRTRTPSAARGPASFRPHLPKKPKPICSASRPCYAAARAR